MSNPPGRLRPRPLAERGRAVVLVAALVVLLAGVAATAGMSRPGAGVTQGYTLPPAALFGWGAAVAVAAGLALTLAGPMWSSREKWTAFVVALLLLLGFAVLAERSFRQAQPIASPPPQTQATAAAKPPVTPTPPQAEPSARARPTPRPALTPASSAVPPWALAVAGAIALLLAAAALRVASRAARGPSRGSTPAAALDAAVESSMADVAAESDPRRAIVAAWLAMGDALARQGIRRESWEAPVEYMRRALGALRVRPESAQRLTALFQRARYSDHPATAGMRDEALAALQGVRDDLHEDTP